MSRRARLALAAAMALGVLLVLPGAALALEQKLVSSDGAAQDSFGRSVDVDGDTAVVGAPRAGKNGAVYVFTRTGDSWTQTAKLTASDGVSGDFLGESVAIAGDTIVAGAASNSSLKGAVYTFARTGAAARTETAKLTAPDGAGGDFLGESVAIDGDTIVAAAPGVAFFKGALYTFTRTGAAARTSTAKLTASDGASFDKLGGAVSLAIDGDTIVAGAASKVGANATQGAVYTFATTGAAARTQTAKLTASDGAAKDLLGGSVAIEGDTIVAGAETDDIGTNADQGSVYTFARTGAVARTQTAKLTALDGAVGDRLGSSVGIDGDTIVAGAATDDIGTPTKADQGSAYTFARTGAPARTETAKLTASDGLANDQLGGSVAIDGDAIVAGAALDDVGANADQGSASIFFAPGAKSKLTVTKAGDGVGSVSSVPPGIDCGFDCSEDYAAGTAVTLTASFSTSTVAGGDGSTFAGFSGCDATPSATTCTVTMDRAKSVTATFVDNPTLTVAKAGSGSGAVTSAPAGIDCGATCAGDFARDSMVTLTANPAAGSTFTGFTGGGCSGAATTCTVTLDQAKNVTATFALRRALTVTKVGSGSGSVTSAPAGIDCGADCTEDYDEGTKVTLTANAAAGSTFTGFTGGGCTVAAATCEVTLDQAKTVTATFAVTPRALTVTKAGSGSGSVTSAPAGIDCGADCTEDYDEGTKVTLTANAAAGSTFTGFTGGGCTGAAATCEVTLNQAQSVTATFAKKPTAPSTPTPTPAPGPSPSAGDGLACPAGNSRGVRCTGRTASGGLVIVGTDGDDTIVGTGKGDRISARGGRDTISGRSGDDFISGGSGSDRISGGAGSDRISGGSGNDRISGNSGDDRLSGNSGNDRLSGNSGNDSIAGGSGRDRLSGGSGKNKVKQ